MTYSGSAECRGTGNCTFCGGTGVGHQIDISKISREFRDLKNWFD
jgi:hypothetical protein